MVSDSPTTREKRKAGRSYVAAAQVRRHASSRELITFHKGQNNLCMSTTSSPQGDFTPSIFACLLSGVDLRPP